MIIVAAASLAMHSPVALARVLIDEAVEDDKIWIEIEPVRTLVEDITLTLEDCDIDWPALPDEPWVIEPYKDCDGEKRGSQDGRHVPSLLSIAGSVAAYSSSLLNASRHVWRGPRGPPHTNKKSKKNFCAHTSVTATIGPELPPRQLFAIGHARLAQITPGGTRADHNRPRRRHSPPYRNVPRRLAARLA